MREISVYAGHVPLLNDSVIVLSDEAAHHLLNVLRVRVGTPLTVFNGKGRELNARLVRIDGKKPVVELHDTLERNCESPLKVELGQVISKGDRMEFILQKSVELGVSSITPLISERCVVRLNEQRMDKKVESWQRIVISACEQCGRNVVPEVREPLPLATWCSLHDPTVLSLTLDPGSSDTLNTLEVSTDRLRLLTGPEGGFSDTEVALTKAHGFATVRLGPRILRTETAPLVALSILGARFGDL